MELGCSDHFQIKFDGVLKAACIICITVAIILANIIVLGVIYSKKQGHCSRDQSRYFITSLTITDLLLGILVTPVSIYPALYGCCPFGEIFCALEALLIAALFHQSTLALVCIALDRYISIIHPLRYNAILTNRRCLIMITATWIISFVVYIFLIFLEMEFSFDYVGIMNCEPLYKKTNIIIFASCIFYFPPVVILGFCYSVIWCATRNQMKKISCLSSYNTNGRGGNHLISETGNMGKYKASNLKNVKTLAAIGLGFVLAVTPWTIKQLVETVTHTTAHPVIEFITTWIAVSNSFWNAIIYSIMNKSFRKVAKQQILCAIWRSTDKLTCHDSTDRDMETY